MNSERLTFVLQLMAIFASVISLLAICATIIVVSAFRKTERSAARTLTLLVSQAGGLQLLTVIVIGVSVLLLRVLELISADAAVSGLTGIAGFVLGGFTRAQSGKEADDDKLRQLNP